MPRKHYIAETWDVTTACSHIKLVVGLSSSFMLCAWYWGCWCDIREDVLCEAVQTMCPESAPYHLVMRSPSNNEIGSSISKVCRNYMLLFCVNPSWTCRSLCPWAVVASQLKYVSELLTWGRLTSTIRNSNDMKYPRSTWLRERHIYYVDILGLSKP